MSESEKETEVERENEKNKNVHRQQAGRQLLRNKHCTCNKRPEPMQMERAHFDLLSCKLNNRSFFSLLNLNIYLSLSSSPARSIFLCLIFLLAHSFAFMLFELVNQMNATKNFTCSFPI